jgi:hypothetical protein
MTQVSGTLHEVAGAIRNAGQELREQQPQIYSVADTAAQQVDKAAEYLEQHEPREILDEVQSVARRQPALLIGGGLALGLALGRILRSAGSAGTSGGDGYRSYGGGSWGQPREYQGRYGIGDSSYGTGTGYGSTGGTGKGYGSTGGTGTGYGSTGGTGTGYGSTGGTDTGTGYGSTGTGYASGGTSGAGTSGTTSRSGSTGAFDTDPGASVIASTTIVEVGSDTETGRTGSTGG